MCAPPRARYITSVIAWLAWARLLHAWAAHADWRILPLPMLYCMAWEAACVIATCKRPATCPATLPIVRCTAGHGTASVLAQAVHSERYRAGWAGTRGPAVKTRQKLPCLLGWPNSCCCRCRLQKLLRLARTGLAGAFTLAPPFLTLLSALTSRHSQACHLAGCGSH